MEDRQDRRRQDRPGHLPRDASMRDRRGRRRNASMRGRRNAGRSEARRGRRRKMVPDPEEADGKSSTIKNESLILKDSFLYLKQSSLFTP